MKSLLNPGLLPFLASLALGMATPQVTRAQSVPVALRGGRILTVSNGVIENGTVLFEDGRITGLGRHVDLPPGTRVVEVAGKTVMPGLIDGFTDLGLADYPSLGQDQDEASNPVTPHLRTIDGLNPENRFIPQARRSGVTAALVAPAGGNLLSGQSALVQLDGATMEAMLLRAPVGVHATLGEGPKNSYGRRDRPPMSRMGSAALLRKTLVAAQEYDRKLEAQRKESAGFAPGELEEEPPPVPRDLKLEALLPVLRGDQPLIIGADRFDDIHTALRVAAEFDVRIILNGGAEAHRLAMPLAQAGVPVVWGPHGAAFREMEAREGTPRTPAALAEAGIPFAFQSGGSENVTGLLTEARWALAYGLDYEDALRGLTLGPARIFGVEGEIGSLDVGKSADILVFDGDPLAETSMVEMVFVRGIQTEPATAGSPGEGHSAAHSSQMHPIQESGSCKHALSEPNNHCWSQ